MYCFPEMYLFKKIQDRLKSNTRTNISQLHYEDRHLKSNFIRFYERAAPKSNYRCIVFTFTSSSLLTPPLDCEQAVRSRVTAGPGWASEKLFENYLCSRPPSRAAAAAKSLQSCPTLCDPIDGSPPGSLNPGILQARTLEWQAPPFTKAPSNILCPSTFSFPSVLVPKYPK